MQQLRARKREAKFSRDPATTMDTTMGMTSTVDASSPSSIAGVFAGPDRRRKGGTGVGSKDRRSPEGKGKEVLSLAKKWGFAL